MFHGNAQEQFKLNKIRQRMGFDKPRLQNGEWSYYSSSRNAFVPGPSPDIRYGIPMEMVANIMNAPAVEPARAAAAHPARSVSAARKEAGELAGLRERIASGKELPSYSGSGSSSSSSSSSSRPAPLPAGVMRIDHRAEALEKFEREHPEYLSQDESVMKALAKKLAEEGMPGKQQFASMLETNALRELPEGFNSWEKLREETAKEFREAEKIRALREAPYLGNEGNIEWLASSLGDSLHAMSAEDVIKMRQEHAAQLQAERQAAPAPVARAHGPAPPPPVHPFAGRLVRPSRRLAAPAPAPAPVFGPGLYPARMVPFLSDRARAARVPAPAPAPPPYQAPYVPVAAAAPASAAAREAEEERIRRAFPADNPNPYWAGIAKEAQEAALLGAREREEARALNPDAANAYVPPAPNPDAWLHHAVGALGVNNPLNNAVRAQREEPEDAMQEMVHPMQFQALLRPFQPPQGNQDMMNMMRNLYAQQLNGPQVQRVRVRPRRDLYQEILGNFGSRPPEFGRNRGRRRRG